MCKKFNDELGGYLKASFPLIYICSSEEERVERLVGNICNAETSNGRMCDLFVWEEGVGIKAGHEDLTGNPDYEWEKIASATDSLPAFVRFITTKSEEAVEAASKSEETKWNRGAFLAKDLHYLFKNPNPVLYRSLRTFARNAKIMGMSMIAIGPSVDLPEELKHEFVVLDCDLPDRTDITKSIAELGLSLRVAGDSDSADAIESALEEDKGVIDAAKGMTEAEVIGSAALSLVKSGKLDREFITEQKVAAIKKSGSLEVMPAESIGNVGGFDLLKGHLHITAKSLTREAREFGIKRPRGIVAAGISGTGKSLTAKAAAGLFGWPLIRFDVASVHGKYVGDSGKNMRSALKTIEAVGRCVVLIDEGEKAMGGSTGPDANAAHSDVMGAYLTWMQETDSEAYVIMTCNQTESLPPELMRRFDDVFFTDLPTEKERKEIFEIHLRKVGRDPAGFNVGHYVTLAKDYSGAEIEQVIQDALGHAFAADAEELTDLFVIDAINRTKPLAQTRKEDIEKMREHGRLHFRMASSEERKQTVKTVKKTRRIQAEKA